MNFLSANGVDIIHAESIDEYHRDACVSSSKLSAFCDRGPAFYLGRYVEKTIPEEKKTDALIEGAAFDTLVTEGPAVYVQRYVVKPGTYVTADDEVKPWNGNANVCKAWLAERVAAGQTVIDRDVHVRFGDMHHALVTHPLWPVICHSGCLPQVTVRKRVTRYGFGVQVRPDFLSVEPCEFSNGRPYTVNLKTTADWSDWFQDDDPESPRAGKPVFTYGYHRQAALDQWLCYQHPALRETAHFLAVVEKQQPYRVAFVRLTDDYLELGFQDVDRDLRRLGRCFATGSWPKSPHTLVVLEPPLWLRDQQVRKAVADAEAQQIDEKAEEMVGMMASADRKAVGQ